VILAVVVGAVIAVRQFYFEGLKPVSPGSQSVQLVTVESGATLDEIADQLKEAGLIKSEWAFKLYVGSQNARDDLQAGTYSLSPGFSAAEIVAILSHGKVSTDLVTIVPGRNLGEIKEAMVSYGFKPADVDAALNPELYAGHPALVDKPAGASLEGYLYPDSYQKDASTTPEQIFAKALDEMNEKLSPDLRAAFAAEGLSVYEAIILASVVEREVSSPQDRAQVAQVFLKRLREGIALESNATQPKFNSYNNPGLPSEPISNVSISSLLAVAHPADTDWLYFVSGDDGTTHFSHTLSEHEAKVQKYCTKLCL
jgi:UPF0755 protein